MKVVSCSNTTGVLWPFIITTGKCEKRSLDVIFVGSMGSRECVCEIITGAGAELYARFFPDVRDNLHIAPHRRLRIATLAQ